MGGEGKLPLKCHYFTPIALLIQQSERHQVRHKVRGNFHLLPTFKTPFIDSSIPPIITHSIVLCTARKKKKKKHCHWFQDVSQFQKCVNVKKMDILETMRNGNILLAKSASLVFKMKNDLHYFQLNHQKGKFFSVLCYHHPDFYLSLFTSA